MKYEKIIEMLRNEFVHNSKISKDRLYEIYYKIYGNRNDKTFENMVSILKKNEIITDYSKTDYLVTLKSLYNLRKYEEVIDFYKKINMMYKDIKIVIWNTDILNEFTRHYVINNYIVIETEKFAIEPILTLLKEKFMKKYTIVTEKMYNENKNMFLNDENMIILKQLIVKAPVENEDNILKPTLEKIMVDIYKDKLYEQYQGKELETIYKNIFEKYNVNFKKLFSYANERTDLEKYKKYIEKLNVIK